MRVAGHEIPPDLAALLERFRFDRVPFEELRARLIAAGDDLEGLHRIRESIEVPPGDVAHPLPAPGSPEGAGGAGTASRTAQPMAGRSPPGAPPSPDR